MLESSNGRDYVTVFSAMKPQRASFVVAVYGSRHAYEFAVDDDAIDRPTGNKYTPYRSAPILVENPDSGPLRAYSIDVRIVGAPKCEPERSSIPDVASVVRPPYPRSPEEVATLHDIVAETAALTTVVNPTPRTDLAVPQCDEPFAEARTLRVQTPKYPIIAINQSAIGSATVKVTLSDSGSVTDATIYKGSGWPALDAAAIEAARNSTYSPEVIFCKPYAGSYIFRADFAAR